MKIVLQLLMTGSSHFSKRKTQENYNLGFYYLEKDKLKSVSKLMLWKLQPAWKKKQNSSLSGPADLLRSNCFKALWISVTVNGVRLNCYLKGAESVCWLCDCFRSWLRDSNKKLEEIKCSLKQFRIVILSVKCMSHSQCRLVSFIPTWKFYNIPKFHRVI